METASRQSSRTSKLSDRLSTGSKTFAAGYQICQNVTRDAAGRSQDDPGMPDDHLYMQLVRNTNVRQQITVSILKQDLRFYLTSNQRLTPPIWFDQVIHVAYSSTLNRPSRRGEKTKRVGVEARRQGWRKRALNGSLTRQKQVDSYAKHSNRAPLYQSLARTD